MDRKEALFDKFVFRIKNNPLVAVLLFVATIVVATATFTDAAQKILILFAKEEMTNVTGKWQTQVLVSPYDEGVRSILIIEFVQQGDRLSGVVTQMGIDRSESHAKHIVDGTIRDDVISFHTPSETWLNDTRVQVVSYKESYFGRLNKNKDEIALERLSEAPSAVQETLVARRN